ncbi:MAG TPA: riboflavin synthase [Solirubrobacteraceae bacterium]|nr:riboflavin synthase [Solirubrobacteraceae bacterium]
MFTGLVADQGQVTEVQPTPDGARLTVRTQLATEVSEGDSIAVDGVCLTATAVRDGAFSTDVMNETLSHTSLAETRPGAPVNLELAMRASDRLGGHIVQGHVDGVGAVRQVVPDGFAQRVTIDAPDGLLRYAVHKGSITVNGVSLTVAELDDRCFTVSLIPETLERTNLGRLAAGDPVNLEVDVLAKYVERLVSR